MNLRDSVKTIVSNLLVARAAQQFNALPDPHILCCIGLALDRRCFEIQGIVWLECQVDFPVQSDSFGMANAQIVAAIPFIVEEIPSLLQHIIQRECESTATPYQAAIKIE